jgi:hypothetical protein
MISIVNPGVSDASEDVADYNAVALAALIGQPAYAQALPSPALSAPPPKADGGAAQPGRSAKKGIVTVSVVSDARGAFSFPAAKLGAGDYTITIRAAGYVLEGPRTVTIAADKPAQIDVTLGKTKNLASQLTNLEWMLSVPGTDEQKRALTGCTNCHSVERILSSSHNAEEFMAVIKRMATYSNNSLSRSCRCAPSRAHQCSCPADKVAAYSPAST